MDKSSMQIIVFFAMVVFVAVYVTITNNKRKQNAIINKLKNGWGKPAQRKYTGDDYECISHYFKRNEDENSIDDITWNDLGMDAVFCMMNNTNSSAGQEYLYKMLSHRYSLVNIPLLIFILSPFLTYKMWVSLLRGILRKSAKSFLVFISLKFPMVFLLKKVSAWQLITLDKHE